MVKEMGWSRRWGFVNAMEMVKEIGMGKEMGKAEEMGMVKETGMANKEITVLKSEEVYRLVFAGDSITANFGHTSRRITQLIFQL